MDFRRIEAIFLFVFVVLDFFLFFSWRSSEGAPVQTDTSTGNQSGFVREMQLDNISVNKLSTKTGSGFYLASRPNTVLMTEAHRLVNQSTSFDSTRTTLSSKLGTSLRVSKDHPQEAVQKWMTRSTNVLFGNQYEYVPEVSDANRLVFAQRWQDRLILDSHGQLVFQVQDGVVTGYTQTYINHLSVLQEMDQTKSAQEAVMLLYTYSEIPTNSRVQWEKLAYGWLLDAKGSTIYIPIWYVGIENKNTKVVTVKRVNAFSGAVLKTTDDDRTAVSSS